MAEQQGAPHSKLNYVPKFETFLPFTVRFWSQSWFYNHENIKHVG